MLCLPIESVPTFPLMPPLTLLWRSSRFDLRLCSLDQYRMTANVLSLHISGCLEIVIPITETYEPIALRLGRPLVPDNTRFLHRRVL